MDHSEAENGEIIDRYIKLELKEDEELAFEEHLLGCPVCRKRLYETRTAIEAIETSKTHEFWTAGNEGAGKERPASRIKSYSIAAGFILLAGLSVLIMIKTENKKIYLSEKAVIPSGRDSLNTAVVSDKVIISDLDTNSDRLKNELPVLVAGNFVPSPFYENIISDRMRKPELLVLSPPGDTIDSHPVVRWESREVKELTLVLISNKESELFRTKIKNGSVITEISKPGLYYWQLQDDKETLFTGKFIYIPASAR